MDIDVDTVRGAQRRLCLSVFEQIKMEIYKYVVSELGSILENAADMGAPVPKFLKAILEKVRATCETNQEK